MKILVSTPTYDRRIDVDLFRALINAERTGRHDLDFVFPISSHLSRNRNYCVHELLKNGHDALLFLDSDIGIYDNNFIDKLLDTGYKLDAKIIGGAYRMKQDEIKYIAGNKKSDGKYENLKEATKPSLVSATGTGIMLVFREVFEKMPDPWFQIIDKANLEVMPEDFEFCRKAEELGFKVALDPSFATSHYGMYAYTHQCG